MPVQPLTPEEKRLIKKYPLQDGAHECKSEGTCVMEVISIVQDEKFSDGPKGVSQFLRKLGIEINDSFYFMRFRGSAASAHRGRVLRPLIPYFRGSSEVPHQTQEARSREFLLSYIVNRLYQWGLSAEVTEEQAELAESLRNIAISKSLSGSRRLELLRGRLEGLGDDLLSDAPAVLMRLRWLEMPFEGYELLEDIVCDSDVLLDMSVTEIQNMVKYIRTGDVKYLLSDEVVRAR